MINSYDEYMISECWRLKRCERLRIDSFECRTCTEKNKLEVHHRHYKKPFGEESVDDDLITLCSKCHDAISKRMGHGKYRKTPKKPTIQLSHFRI